VFTCGQWCGLRTEPHMAELIMKVWKLWPNFALGFDQQQLVWLLGGSHDNCWVHGWMVVEPTEVTAQKHCDSLVASSSCNGVGSQLEWNPSGATTLARFLMSVVRLWANIVIRSPGGLMQVRHLMGSHTPPQANAPIHGYGRPCTGQEWGCTQVFSE
jgi:hypothetical protein